MANLIKIKPGVPMKMDSGDNPTFEEWIKRVNAFLTRTCGLIIDDLPDCNYATWYESRLRPIRAAQRALKNAGDY